MLNRFARLILSIRLSIIELSNCASNVIHVLYTYKLLLIDSRILTLYARNILQTQKVWHSQRSIFSFSSFFSFLSKRKKKRGKLSFRPHGGKSVAYTQTVECVCEFVFTRQQVDVTDVLSALSYDGSTDVWTVCHSVSGGCRAHGFEMIVSSDQ